MRKSYTVTVPSVRIVTKNKDVYETTRDIVNSSSFTSIFYMLMHKLTLDPNILSLKESSTDIKMSRTINGLEAIATVLGDMKTEQEQSRSQLSESISLLNTVTDKLGVVEGQSQKQNDVLKKIMDILSESDEGLDILRRVNETVSIDLNDLVTEHVSDTEFLTEVGTQITQLSQSSLNFEFVPTATEDLDDFEEEEESDFSAEELQQIHQRFKSE